MFSLGVPGSVTCIQLLLVVRERLLHWSLCAYLTSKSIYMCHKNPYPYRPYGPPTLEWTQPGVASLEPNPFLGNFFLLQHGYRNTAAVRSWHTDD